MIWLKCKECGKIKSPNIDDWRYIKVDSKMSLFCAECAVKIEKEINPLGIKDFGKELALTGFGILLIGIAFLASLSVLHATLISSTYLKCLMD